MIVRGRFKTCAQSFKTNGGIQSKPVAFLGLSFFNSVSTVFSETYECLFFHFFNDTTEKRAERI